jgi:tetratricopeptide (TPR) repeat protein
MKTREFLTFLNDEARVGGKAASALVQAGVADRDALLRSHPEWLRYGTLIALLNAAHDALNIDPLEALELARLVLALVPKTSIPTSPAFLRDQIVGLAWKERGNAFYTQGRDYQDAADAGLRAAEILGTNPVLEVERASALVLVALALHKLGRSPDAEEVLAEAIRIFADHGEARRFLDAIQTQAIIALDHNDLPRAQERYLRAYEEADRLDDRPERTRMRSPR